MEEVSHNVEKINPALIFEYRCLTSIMTLPKFIALVRSLIYKKNVMVSAAICRQDNESYNRIICSHEEEILGYDGLPIAKYLHKEVKISDDVIVKYHYGIECPDMTSLEILGKIKATSPNTWNSDPDRKLLPISLKM